MGRLMLQECAKVLTHGAVVALEEELVFVYEEVTTGLGLDFLAVAANRASTIVQIGALPLEQLQLRRHHSDKLVVDEKSQTLVPNL